MNYKLWLTGVSLLCVLTALAACGGGSGGGGGDGSAAVSPPNNGGGAGGGVTQKAWGTAVLIETDNVEHASGPQIAIDANGHALAVWQQFDGTRYHIWYNRYTAGADWGTATLIETDARNPQIAMNANGDALAVWFQSGGIWSNRYTASTGWGTAALIGPGGASGAGSAQIVIDADGNALVLWHRFEQANDGDIWSNRYTVGTGWGTAALIENNAGDARSPQIAIDANGNAVAVWQQSEFNNIWTNRYTAGTGWGMAALIGTGSAGPAFHPQLAVDPSGNAVVVWTQYNDAGNNTNVWSSRYTAGTGWNTATLIETDNAAGGAHVPEIAIDANGNALAVWEQSDGTRYNIWSNRYTAGTGWGTAALIENDAGGAGAPAQIAIDANGNALAVWGQSDGVGRGRIWSNRYAAGTGWGTAAIIETLNFGAANGPPQIAANANGNAVAVWEHSDGMRTNILANRFE